MLSVPGANARTLLAQLPSAAAFTSSELATVNGRAFFAMAETMLHDDLLDETEESDLLAAARTLGISDERFQSEFRAVAQRLVVARVNDGRIPQMNPEDVRITLQPGETAHLTAGATLMKMNPVRQYQGASSGFSFRVAKGVYYRTGSSRGRSVVVGHELGIDDHGVLTLTSRRAVYSGTKKALQFEYSKLLDVEVFTDGIRLAVTNRQTPSLMKLDIGGDVVAAVINAAAQRL